MQTIFRCHSPYTGLDTWLTDHNVKNLLLVCGASAAGLKINEYFNTLTERTGIKVTRFSDFSPNPVYESVAAGVDVFRNRACDAVIAVGGGSAMDVAKCIRLFSNMDSSRNYLEQVIVPNGIPFLAMPTTAGTGSEATRFAVIYYKGAKQSVTDLSCIPDAVLFDSTVLETLPLYQKKATMMDAFCHALESFWSVNSTPESKSFSREAIRLILTHMDAYLANKPEGNEGMLLAANIAGKAINITQTPAGHAMCYKITSLFGTAHGHAAALCCRELFPWMIKNTGSCIDQRGADYLLNTLHEIADAMGCGTPQEASDRFDAIFDELELTVPEASPSQFAELRTSVNPQRLRNHPVLLDEQAIDLLYHRILKEPTVFCG